MVCLGMGYCTSTALDQPPSGLASVFNIYEMSEDIWDGGAGSQPRHKEMRPGALTPCHMHADSPGCPFYLLTLPSLPRDPSLTFAYKDSFGDQWLSEWLPNRVTCTCRESPGESPVWPTLAILHV